MKTRRTFTTLSSKLRRLARATSPPAPLLKERGERPRALSFQAPLLQERGWGEVARARTAAFVTLVLFAVGALPARAADLSLDVTAEHLSATFTGDRTAEASAVTLAVGWMPGDRLAVRVEVPALRARSSQTLLARLGPTPRVLQALAAGNRALQRQVPGEWQTGLGDVRLEAQGELAGGGARLYRLAAELDVKAPTADEERGLGTGEWDARLGLLGERRFWSATLFGGAGYSRLGDPRRLELRDVPDGFLGIESEPWHELRAAAWIEGHGAVLAGAEARSALGIGVRRSGRTPWRLVATVGLTGAEEEIGFLFGVSVLDAADGGSWGRPAGRRRR
jgi:hypothetical protein